jgi:hypothetical protein
MQTPILASIRVPKLRVGMHTSTLRVETAEERGGAAG